MQLSLNTQALLTQQELKNILNDLPVAYAKPSDPHIPTIELPVFRKQGVLVDLDEITGEAETLAKQQSKPGNANTTHSQSYSCIECRRQLPTAHLLDLHITEQHDLYFAASVERADKPMYACYIEECEQKFHNVAERKNHCIAVHKFPTNYRFDQANNTKIKKQTSGTQRMDVDDNLLPAKSPKPLPYIKAFSFGHPTQRTFNTRSRIGGGAAAGKDLLDVKEMQEALNEMN